VGGNPFAAYIGLMQGAFGSAKAISETAIWATPYIFAGLAVALAFKGGLFNIGAEGQLALGAVAAAWVGYALPGMLGFDLPAAVHIPLVIGFGMLVGALWGAIPGALKAFAGGHEVINTIMMNYIALNLTSFLLNGPMKDKTPTNVIARTPEIAVSARIPVLFDGLRVHWGFFSGVADGRTGVVVNGWHAPLLIRAAEPLIALMRRLAGKGAKKKKDWLNAEDPEGTFIAKLTPAWLKREIGAKIPLEIRPWRSLSTRLLRWFIQPKLGGKTFLRFVFWLEGVFPHFFAENGQYPLIVIKKGF